MIARFFALLLMLCGLAIPAQGTISSSANKTIALGTGAQTVFTFGFVGVAPAFITVVFTDASGNQTTLTQGTGATQYQIALNPPGTGQIWGIGGTVTYNPGGTPIASGTTLTIFRTLPLTQAVALQNQFSVGAVGKGAETGLDTGVMQTQQVFEQIGRALQMNIANTVAPLPLPPAAAAANKGLCFDGTGNNVIACTTAPAGTISGAMTPVVGAATLALGRTALGLASMSQEVINGGTCGGASLQDDGAGNARVVPTTAGDAGATAVTCAFHLTQRMATGTIAYTLGAAQATYFNGFSFTINALTGIVTVIPNAADNFVVGNTSVASGTGIAIPQGSVCRITTNAAANATWWLDCSNSQASLSASVGSSALTLTLSGSTVLPFRDTTLANGDAKWAIPVGGLSITVPSGATLGTSNGVPFRVWIFAAYNAGTPVLGVATCSTSSATATTLFPCAAWETIQKSGTGITAGSSAAGTLYTSATVTNDAVRILGYAEYGSGLGTAGAWASAPTTLQLCIPPFVCTRPGQPTGNSISATISAASTTTSNTFVALTSQNISITPTSSANVISVFASGNVSESGTGASMNVRLSRGTTAATNLFGNTASTSLVAVQSTGSNVTMAGYDFPGSLSAVTYAVQGDISTGTLTYSSTPTFMSVQEIMGALEPANDNGSLEQRMVG